MNKTLKPSAAALPLLFSLLVLAGCSLAPPYTAPHLAGPDLFKEAAPEAGSAAQWKTAAPAEALARGQWWTIFGDARLAALETEALGANQNLKAAAARLLQARSLTRSAQAERAPQIGVGVGGLRQKPSAAAQGLSAGSNTPITTLWRAQTSASYEVDLFGRVASSVSVAQASAQQSEALFRSVLLALQADVASVYFQVRELDAEQALYARTLGLREDELTLVRKRFEAGDVGELDLAHARTELAAAQAESQGIARQRANAEHALAVLLGKSPATFDLPAAPLARVELSIPAGLPSALLERRPDIAAAERAMAAANARIGVAKSAFFPNLMLTGAAGFESADLGDLLNWSSRSFLLGPLAGTVLSLPIFDGGRRQADLDRARAAYEEEGANYRQSVLVAFREVEDNLAGLRILGSQTQAQQEAVSAAQRAAQLSLMQYREGLVSYHDVIDADRSVLTHQRGLVQLDGERARTVVGLIRALGGGWETPALAQR